METIISLVPSAISVAMVMEKLERAGIAENMVSVLFQPSDVWQRLGGRQKLWTAVKYAAVGALIGLIIFSLIGTPAGGIRCESSICSPMTKFFLWALSSRNWVIVFGVFGIVIGIDDLAEDLFPYIEGVRHGQALLVIEAPEEKAPEAMYILRQERGALIRDIHENKA